MESKKLGSKIYLRVDKNEEILNSIIKTCEKYNIKSATFSGLGACQKVVIGTYIPQKDDFQLHTKETMLEMVNLTGNITYDPENNKRNFHAHGMFSYLEDGEIHYFGGDLKSAEVMYTGEITIEPVEDGVITKKYDPNVKIDVWNFEQE